MEAARSGEANERLVHSAVSLWGDRIPKDRTAERKRKQAAFWCLQRGGKCEEPNSLTLRPFVGLFETACSVESTSCVGGGRNKKLKMVLAVKELALN